MVPAPGNEWAVMIVLRAVLLPVVSVVGVILVKARVVVVSVVTME